MLSVWIVHDRCAKLGILLTAQVRHPRPLCYGQQEKSAYNGHFESTCYHPLLLFNGEGNCLAAKLRPGNVHSTEDWEELLLPEIERQQRLGKKVVFRADAAFAKPEIYEALEERGVKYAIRISANDGLEREVFSSIRKHRLWCVFAANSKVLENGHCTRI